MKTPPGCALVRHAHAGGVELGCEFKVVVGSAVSPWSFAYALDRGPRTRRVRWVRVQVREAGPPM